MYVKEKNMLHVKVGAKAFIYTYSIHQEHTSTHIYIYTSVNPCIKCMEFSVTQVGVSEFSETLTGGFTKEFSLPEE